MSLHAYEDAREQRSTFPHDLLQSHSLVGCRELTRSKRTDYGQNLSLESQRRVVEASRADFTPQLRRMRKGAARACPTDKLLQPLCLCCERVFLWLWLSMEPIATAASCSVPLWMGSSLLVLHRAENIHNTTPVSGCWL